MKTFKIDVSKIVLDEDTESPFEGYVRLRVPNVKERFDMVADMGIESKDGVGVKEGMKVFDIVINNIESVEVTHIESGIEINSVDDLSYYQESSSLLQTFSQYLMNGVPLGKGLLSP